MVRAITILRIAPTSFVVAIGLLSALGLAGAWAVAQDATTLGVALWMLPSVVVGALFTVYGTALLQGSIVGSAIEFDRGVLWRQGRILIAVFVIFSVTVSIAGLLYVKDLRTTVRQQRFDQQLAIANLKARFIQNWLAERSLDTRQRARAIAALLADSGEPPTREARSLIEVLFAEMLARSPERTGLALFSVDGQRLASAGESIGPEDASRILAIASRPGATSQPSIQQRRLAATGALRLDFVAPIIQAPGRPPAVRLVVTFDPTTFLLPEVMRWPTDSADSDIVLVQRLGDRAVSVVLPARAQRDARSQISLALSQTNVVGVQAVLYGDGVREGIDYRGEPVLAASRHVDGLDWYVVAKTDVAEVLTLIDQRARLVVWLTLGAILVAAVTSIGLWHAERASASALRERHEQERTALTRHYEQIMKHASDIILLQDEERHIIDANDAARRAFGYSLEELRTMYAVDLYADSAKSDIEVQWPATLASGIPFVTMNRRKDGSTFPVEISGNVFQIGGKRYLQCFVRDISRHKHLEAEIARLGQLPSAMRTATDLLLRSQDEQGLYQAMCDTLVKVGGYRLVQVGLATHESAPSFRFVAAAGYDVGNPESAAANWGDGTGLPGPTAEAIRTGEVQINQDVERNTVMAPWKDEALKRGLRASIGLPLSADDAVFGALVLYSDKPFAFGRDEVAFLAQFAANISYGVTLLRAKRA